MTQNNTNPLPAQVRSIVQSPAGKKPVQAHAVFFFWSTETTARYEPVQRTEYRLEDEVFGSTSEISVWGGSTTDK